MNERSPVVECTLLLRKKGERDARLSTKAETIDPKGMNSHFGETYYYTLEERCVGEE